MKLMLLALGLSLFTPGCTTLESLLHANTVIHEATAPVAPAGSAPASSSNGGGSCCVNGAFYACASGAALARCGGEPLALMQCAQSCPFGDDRCEPDCIRDHGPDPSSCDRDPERDAQCSAR